MEIQVTSIINEHLNGEISADLCSGSVAELGHNAAQITWNNSCETAKRFPIVTEENREDIISHFEEYGAWEREEIEQDLEGLALQEIMAAIRQLESAGLDLENFDDKEFTEAIEQEGGMLFKTDGEWYFHFGN